FQYDAVDRRDEVRARFRALRAFERELGFFHRGLRLRQVGHADEALFLQAPRGFVVEARRVVALLVTFATDFEAHVFAADVCDFVAGFHGVAFGKAARGLAVFGDRVGNLQRADDERRQ